MTTTTNPSNSNDDFPEETPESLKGIADRLRCAIEELFVVDAETVESAELSVQAEFARSETDQSDGIQQPTIDPASANIDRRLYLPAPEGWQVRIKSGPREYCYYQKPGEDWFHTLIDGELYLQNGEENVCLNCAHRRGVLVDNRLFWQAGRGKPQRVIENDCE